MAEAVGSSASRKRKAKKGEPPIIQLSCAKLCGCAECWKKADLCPSILQSASLDAKKPKQTEPLDHERQTSSNSFVYDVHNVQEHLSCCSPDGRYMFLFTHQMDLLIVDLWQNARKVLKSPTEWPSNVRVYNTVALGYGSILLRTLKDGDVRYVDDNSEERDSDDDVDDDLDVDDDQIELRLFRFGKDSEEYENILLHGSPEWVSFALTEISGQEVMVKQAIVGNCTHGATVFLRLNVDEAAITVDHTVDLSARRDRHLVMCYGQNVYAINLYEPQLLSAYSLEQKKWLKDVQLDTEELDAEKSKPMHNWLRGFSPLQSMYVEIFRQNDHSLPRALFRCDIEAKKWEQVPVDARNLLHLSSIVNPVDGTEDGLVVVKVSSRFAYYGNRFKVERIMFRRPDSLEHLSLIAVRKSREDVEGEEGFQRKMSVRPQKRCLPRWYEEMEPIPVHKIQ